jgi:hypothetical protein
MSEQTNTKIVQDVYAAFGRADIPALLNSLSADIDWQAIVGAGPKVPTAGPRKGQAAVAQFFKDLAGSILFSTFDPREFVAQGDKVVALGHYAGKANKTGRTFASDWVMVFTIKNGKIVHFREYADVVAITAAF